MDSIIDMLVLLTGDEKNLPVVSPKELNFAGVVENKANHTSKNRFKKLDLPNHSFMNKPVSITCEAKTSLVLSPKE